MKREEAAARLGMSVDEVTEVKDTRDGPVATTHDGHRQLITDDEVFWYGYTPGVPAAKGGPPNAGLRLWVPGGDPVEVEVPKKTTATAKK